MIKDINDAKNIIIKANVKIGIKIIFAKTEIMFRLLKKYAITNTIVIVVERLIETASIIVFGILVTERAFWIGLYNNVIPTTQEKLNKNPTSNTHNGFNKNIIIPAIEIDVKLSYSLPVILAVNRIKDIILALITETEKPHK